MNIIILLNKFNKLFIIINLTIFQFINSYSFCIFISYIFSKNYLDMNILFIYSYLIITNNYFKAEILGYLFFYIEISL